MALSFEESLKKAREAAEAAALKAAEPVASMTSMMNIMDEPSALAYSGDVMLADIYAGEDEVLSDKYLYYPEYSDEAISTIDEKKNIVLSEDQINITQESNSQYIPFRMPRFYDGFDLATTTLMIHFVNKNGYEDYAAPINVYIGSEKLRFAWLVDKRVTAIEGKVKFEVEAIGVNSRGDEYVWKSKPSDKLNILESLSGNGIIEPDNTWVTGFLTQVTDQVALAQAAAKSANDAVDAVRTFADEAKVAAASAQEVVDGAKAELEASVDAAVTSAVEESLIDYITKIEVTAALGNYYTKSEVDELIENIDISEQLAEVREEIANIDGLAAFNVEYNGSVMTFYNGDAVIKSIEISSDPTEEWVANYSASVDAKIAGAKNELSGSLAAHEEAARAEFDAIGTDLEGIHSAIDGLPETLSTDYYNKTDSDERFATKTEIGNLNTTVSGLSATVNTNKSDIAELGGQVAEVQDRISSVDTTPRKTYDMAYNDAEDPDVGENKLVLYEIENEGLTDEVKTVKQRFTIVGGGGGSSGGTLKVEYITRSPVVVTMKDDVIIKYKFSGVDSAGDAVTDATATWKLGGRVIASGLAVADKELTFDATKYVTLGTQKLLLTVTDDSGNIATKSWTVQKIDIKIESDFNDTFTYPLGDISFNYTPHGAISKEVHFVLDGEKLGSITTTASNIPMAYTLPAQSHGAHLLEAYITAEVDGGTVEPEHIFKDIIWYDAESKVPVIGCIYQNFTVRQYDAKNIVYTVYDPSTETPTVKISVDGGEPSTFILDKATSTYTFKSSDIGSHVITISCGDTVKTLNATVTKLDINVEPVTAGLVFDFNPSGKNNANETDRAWTDGDVKMTVSDNFDWINGGYQYDNNGDQYFCIKAGTFAEIDYKLFADDAKKNGKEMKLVFRTTNVARPDASFLSCMDNTTGSDHIGIHMGVHEAKIYGQAADYLELPYSEEDIIEFEFNISKDTEAIPMIMGYEDGVSTRPMVYDASYNFTQFSPKTISLGSDDCDLHIYRFKVYNTSLTDRGILNNFIADARNASEIVDRYERNQIYDENQNLDPDIFAEKCPWLRVYKLSAPYFTNNKSDKVPYTTIQQIYKDGDSVLDNWTCYDCSHSGRTSTCPLYMETYT